MVTSGIGIGHHLFNHAHLVEIGCVDVEALEEPVVVWGQYYAVNGSVLSNVETAQWSVRREDARGWHTRNGGAAMPAKVAHDGVHRLVEHGGQLVEVLLAKEYEQEHLPGAINIPLEMLNHETAAQLQQHQPVIVYCYDSL
jgi:hypothetical protein